jgi:phosphoglycerate dehydrogenase-like enzyme
VRPFHVALTADFLREDGRPIVPDLGLALLDSIPGVERRFLATAAGAIGGDQLAGVDAVIVLSPRVTAESLAGADDLILIARFGVGYDSVDVDACTAAGVMLTITPEVVGRAMGLAAITLLLAVSHRLVVKDRLTREGGWAKRIDHFGTVPTDKVLGIIGLGRVGRELARFGAGLGMRPIAVDPLADAAAASAAGADLTDLATLLATADAVVVCCPLTPETHHLIDAAAIGRMKRTAIVINVARGPIVDQAALTEALAAGRLQGAGLDVFETEPIAPDDPLLALPNVVLAPHSLGWTQEGFRDIGLSASRAVVDVAAGRVPEYLVNRDVLSHDRIRARLARAAGGH